MIEYIRGELTEITPAMAVVEAAGVGYALNISLNTYAAIQNKKEVKLYVHEALVTGGRDDSFSLYGFANKEERELYRQLITVSGVGANTARMILSALTPAELGNVIASGDERTLKGAPAAPDPINKEVRQEAISALTMLGFSPAPTSKVVTEILRQQPNLPVEQVVKLALKQIK